MKGEVRRGSEGGKDRKKDDGKEERGGRQKSRGGEGGEGGPRGVGDGAGQQCQGVHAAPPIEAQCWGRPSPSVVHASPWPPSPELVLHLKRPLPIYSGSCKCCTLREGAWSLTSTVTWPFFFCFCVA